MTDHQKDMSMIYWCGEFSLRHLAVHLKLKGKNNPNDKNMAKIQNTI